MNGLKTIMENFEITCDGFLGKKLLIKQLKKGYRAGFDAVVLAAAVRGFFGAKVLDVGCGVGVASFCLAFRCKGLEITGIDAYEQMVALAKENLLLNPSLQSKLCFSCKRIKEKMPGFSLPVYDIVMTNPPFYQKGKVTEPACKFKAYANIRDISLNAWLQFCWTSLKEKGVCYIVYLSRAIEELTTILKTYPGSWSVFPIFYRQFKEAPICLVEWRKSYQPICERKLYSFYTQTGTQTPYGKSILWEGESLDYLVQEKINNSTNS